MNVLPNGVSTIRVAMISAVAMGLTACASEPVHGPHGFGPMMMLNAPSAPVSTASDEPASPMQELSHKSLAAKVLTSRALETVTGLAIDPARLSEHD
jgi:hypothetical protein